MTKKKSLRRKIRRWFKRPKHLKARTKLLELQKLSLICFIGNSTEIEKPDPATIQLFRMGMSIFTTYWQKFVAWLLKWFPRITEPLIRVFRNHPYFILSLSGLAIALLILQKQLKEAREESGRWIKWWIIIIFILLTICLLRLITDIPPIPIRAAILSLMKKISGELNSSSRLNPEMMSEAKPPSERNKAIVFLLGTYLVLRYLVKYYKRRVFEDLPIPGGDLLFELYKQHEGDNSPKPIMGII